MITEEDSIEQASNARRERLLALRAAKEFLSTPDENPLQNGSKVEDPEEAHGEKKVMAVEEESITQVAASRHDEGSVQSGSNTEDSEDADEENRLNMKFRNYLPHDKQLQGGKLAPTVLPKFEDPVATTAPLPEKIEDPFVNIAPKKPNWDLRRDVQKRLDKLERRTQKALYQLMEEQKEKEASEGENGVAED